MDSKPSFSRFHGRINGSRRQCAYPGCPEIGEFRAPDPAGRSASPNGPGDYQYLCLDHVREFNARYNWFAGMSAEQIADAQSPTYVWPNETRAFSAAAGVDSPPKWQDFHDPLDAISARFKKRVEDAIPATSADGRLLTKEERHALMVLGLDYKAERRAIRSAYSKLVRKYHPDKNGGDRSFEKKLQAVIEAYNCLNVSL
jgi:hypothetical protein